MTTLRWVRAASTAFLLPLFGCAEGTGPDPHVPASITVQPLQPVIASLGDTLRLNAMVRNSGGEVIQGAVVTWSSGTPTVASVDAAGVVTARANGTTLVTARLDALSGTTTVTVRQAPASLSLEPQQPTLGAIEDTVRLHTTVLDAGGSTIDDAVVVWTSSSPDIASVDSTGLVTARANGDATITAASGGASDTTTLRVKQVPTFIAVEQRQPTLEAIDDTLAMTVAVRDSAGHTVTDALVAWSSGTPAVASVNAAGAVTAHSNGTTLVTARLDALSDTTTVTVSQAPASLSLEPRQPTLGAIEDTVRLRTTVLDAGGSTIDNAVVVWTSSSPDIASVDSTGLVTAWTNGDATITAASGGASDTTTIRVAQVPASIAIEPRQPTLTAIEDTLVMTATVRDSTGHTVTDALVTWTSGTPAVASVDAAGAVIAAANGSTVVTAGAGQVADTTTVMVEQVPTALVFTVQPADVLQGEVFAAIQIELRDSRGHLATNATDSVTLSPMPSGTLGGTARAAAVAGVATFDSLTLGPAGAGYRLAAAAAGVPTTISGFFNVHLAFARISVGGLHACGLTADGAAYCWGYNSNGRVGDGTKTDRDVPVRIGPELSFADLAAGSAPTAALDSAGAVIEWGDGTVVPTALAAPEPFASVVSGWHDCALTAAGLAYCWREPPAAFGGGAVYTMVDTPTVAMAGETLLAIAAGGYFTCAIHTDGTAWCAGNNPNGELGNGGNAFALTPTPVLGGMHFAALDAGNEYTCGITTDGPTYCWGNNEQGQLGNPAAGDSSVTPVEVAGGHAFIALSVGATHACGLTAEGQAWCWGEATYGMLGVDVSGPQPEPLAAAGTLRFRAISAGNFHTCGIAEDGYTYCWGFNAYGALGNGDRLSGPTPVRIAPPWL